MRRLVPFGVVAAVELVGVALDNLVLQWLTKPLLAPLLLLWLLRPGPGRPGAGRTTDDAAHTDRRRRFDAFALGLVFATAGDVALLLPGEPAFLVGMGCFLGTQVSLVVAFTRHRRPPVAVVAGYLALWALANAALWGPLGTLRLPVLGYSLALCLMAAAAAGVSGRAAAGGALFLVSDLLIGVDAAGTTLPGHGLLVMGTYVAALLLLTAAWAAAGAPGSPGRTRRAGADRAARRGAATP
ncbi:lysoplasmalogenase family protein [Micromonospora sp. WMMD712]|uniref:lysoplasmalogenase family protein n=1 Tax=Micromonospora sp. WMMD712 TaxID=3016096 RepID=UPI00249B7283|nr:lysoplasmalogenase family protein [Micromonospora sp. WMMD712]WFE55532.1 lysoplasmalogenase family protein [Micromonospora sp. WMMD712]